MQHFGWLESLNIWTQCAVVFFALLPLLTGAAFLLRRRFSIRSALVAVTMFTIFMAITFRPVYEARRLRVPIKKLLASGAVLESEGYDFQFDGKQLTWEFVEAEKSDRSQWWTPMLGKEVQLQLPSEVLSLEVQNDSQFKHFIEAAGEFSNLKRINLSPAISSNLLKNSHKSFGQTCIEQFQYLGSEYPGIRASYISKLKDLSWLEGNQQFRMGIFWGCPNAPNCFLNLNETNLEMLYFHLPGTNDAKINWKEVFRSPTFQKLKFLNLMGYQFSNSEIAELSGMSNLVGLGINISAVSDFSFLKQMTQLRHLVVWSDSPRTNGSIPDLPVPQGLEKLTLSPSGFFFKEEIEKIRKSLPSTCQIDYPNER